MVVAFVQKAAFSGLAAVIAAGAGLVTSASVSPAPAYGSAVVKLEADAAARNAARLFDRADLNNDGDLDRDEYVILAVVTAELANLNGFASLDDGDGVQTVSLPSTRKSDLTAKAKSAIRSNADREFDFAAGDDERLARHEFVAVELERFIANDNDRNGVLVGAELTSYAAAQSRLPLLNS